MGFEVTSRSNRGSPAVSGAETTPAAAPASTTAVERVAPREVESTFERGASPVARLGEMLERLVERRFLTPHDGFLAFDPASRAITTGVDPSAVEHDTPKLGATISALAKILSGKEHGETLTFSAGGLDVKGRPTGRDAELGAGLAGALGQAVLDTVDPKKGGLAEIGITSSDGTAPATARVLVLPRDYAGPIFVSDIDDTLRPTKVEDVIEGDRQAPIAGAKELLDGVAALGIPIVYLSAGTTRIHAVNADFLTQLPAGVLLDNPDAGLKLALESNTASARDQGAYKLGVLQKVKATYPNAKLFGFGDNKYGDALAYTAAGARAFIHHVLADDHNIPRDFTGQQTDDYNPAFRQKVLAELEAALVNVG